MVVSTYDGEGFKLLIAYSPYTDVYAGAPRFLKDEVEHVAHAIYTGKQSRNALDVYLVHDEGLERKLREDNYKISREPKISQINPDKNTEEIFSISYKHIPLDGLWRKVKKAIDFDVEDYARAKQHIPQKRFEREEKLVDKIIPVIIPAYTSVAELFKGKEKFTRSCLFDANIDLSSSCITDLDELGYYRREDDCNYCYALRHHTTPSWKTLRKIEKELLKENMKEYKYAELDGKDIKFIRVGARVESAADMHLSELHKLLEVSIDTGAKLIITTRYNNYHPETADLIKQAESSILFSIGPESLEPGAIAAGHTTEKKLETALKYKEAGVNSLINIISDIPGDRKNLTREEALVFEFSEKYGLEVQTLGLRMNSRVLAKKITGKSWEEHKQDPKQTDLFKENGSKGYHQGKNNQLVPNDIHPDFQDALDKGTLGLCAKTDDAEYCFGCGHRPKQLVVPKKEIKVEYDETRSKANSKKRWNNKKNKLQKELFQ